jgi:ribosome-associated protein
MDNNLSQRPSKSQRKREMLAVQELGKTLVELPASELAQIPLEPRLADAIEAARHITIHEAKRRQLQYIGRLMRDTDLAEIEQALDKIHRKNQSSKAQFHQIERWRDKLITEKDTALQELQEKFPLCDRQKLRQLIRKARDDRETGKNSGAETELFRYLRELIDGPI